MWKRGQAAGAAAGRLRVYWFSRFKCVGQASGGGEAGGYLCHLDALLLIVLDGAIVEQ